MKHLISSRTALCLCGLTLCFNASAQGYVSYNHDAAKMNQITVCLLYTSDAADD